MTFLPLNTDVSLVAPSSTTSNTLSNLSTPVWAKSAGGSRSGDINSGNVIAVDRAGNTYIAGKLQGSNIAFGSTNISTQDGSADAFVTKLDASGNFQWTKTFAGSSSVLPGAALDAGQGITVDSLGNVYVIGSFQGTMQLGGSLSLTSNGVFDAFVLKLNGTDGSVTWGKNFGSAGIDQGFAIGLDSSNNAYITGTFGDISFATQGQTVSSDASFGSFTLTRTGITDAFAAKLDGSNGNVVWAKNYGGSASDTGFGIAATTTGVYVTGNTENAGNFNVFAVKLDSSNGNTLWNKNFGGAGEDSGQAIAVDSSGNAYLTGYLKSATASFDSVALQSASTNTFAVKLNNGDGSVVWVKSLGDSGEEYGNGIGLDASGNVYIGGYFSSSTWNLGTTTLTRSGTTSADGFTLKLNGTNGDLSWARSAGGDKFESVYGVAVDSTGNAYLTSEFYRASLTLGSQTPNGSGGGSNFFVTKLSQDAIVTQPSPLDLVFYDPIQGQVSFGFVGSGTNINSVALTGDTPVLTRNSDLATPKFGTDWRLVSAAVDVDKDNVKDLIFANIFDSTVGVAFGEARTNTDRQFAYRNSAYARINGAILSPGPDWTLEFASNKIGVNDQAGLFWRSKQGGIGIWSLTTSTATNGDKSVAVTSSGIIASVGLNLGWRAVGDGEFNANAATREVFWVNDISGNVATWSLGANRTSTSLTTKLAWTGSVPTSAWAVVGIANMSGAAGANDTIVWQQKSGSIMSNWTMVDGEWRGPAAVVTLTSTDRIKALADVDGDGVLDLVGQFDGNGTIGAYTLTSTFALKNTAAPRTQYTASNLAYRPAKGGPNNSSLELVNVAQYGV